MGPDDTGAQRADELRAWADAVDDAARALASVVAALPGVWADATGQEWAERLRLVGVELVRRADEARETARDVDHPGYGVPFGIRLGGQSGARVTDRRGVVVPVLPPP